MLSSFNFPNFFPLPSHTSRGLGKCSKRPLACAKPIGGARFSKAAGLLAHGAYTVVREYDNTPRTPLAVFFNISIKNVLGMTREFSETCIGLSLLLDAFFNRSSSRCPSRSMKEVVFPYLASGWARFDLGHIDAIGRKGSDEIIEGANPVFCRNNDGGLIFSCPVGFSLRQNKKSGEILDVIFNSGLEYP